MGNDPKYNLAGFDDEVNKYNLSGFDEELKKKEESVPSSGASITGGTPSAPTTSNYTTTATDENQNPVSQTLPKVHNPHLADETVKAFDAGKSLFDNPQHREDYYNALSKKGFDISEAKQVGENYAAGKEFLISHQLTNELQGATNEEAEKEKYQIANALGAVGKHKEALQLYGQIEKQGAVFPELYKGIAYSASKAGDQQMADAAMAKAKQLDKDPNTPAPIDASNNQSAYLNDIAGAMESFTPGAAQAKSLDEGFKESTSKIGEGLRAMKDAPTESAAAFGALKVLAGSAQGGINYLMNTTPIGLGWSEAFKIKDQVQEAYPDSPVKQLDWIFKPLAKGVEKYEKDTGEKVNDAMKDGTTIGDAFIGAIMLHPETYGKIAETAKRLRDGLPIDQEAAKQLQDAVLSEKPDEQHAELANKKQNLSDLTNYVQNDPSAAPLLQGKIQALGDEIANAEKTKASQTVTSAHSEVNKMADDKFKAAVEEKINNPEVPEVVKEELKKSIGSEPEPTTTVVPEVKEEIKGGTKIYRSGKRGRYFTTDIGYIHEGGFQGPVSEFKIPEGAKLLDTRYESGGNEFSDILKLATPEEKDVIKKGNVKNSPEAKEKDRVIDEILKRNNYDGYIIKDAGDTKDFNTVVLREDISPYGKNGSGEAPIPTPDNLGSPAAVETTGKSEAGKEEDGGATEGNQPETYDQFSERYIAKLKEKSPSQPDKWYKGQAKMQYGGYLKRLEKAKGKAPIPNEEKPVIVEEKILTPKEQKPSVTIGQEVRAVHAGSEIKGKIIEDEGDRVTIENEAGRKYPVRKSAILEEGETARSRFDKEFDDKADEVAAKIKKKLKPKATKGIDLLKMGTGVDELIDAAVKIIKDARKAGLDLKEAIDKAVDHIKKNWNQKFGDYNEDDLRQLFDNDHTLSDKYYTKPEDVATPEDVKRILDELPKEEKSIKERLIKAITDNKLTQTIKGVFNNFHPFIGATKTGESIYNDARKTAVILREQLGKQQRENEIADQGSNKRILFWDRQPKENKIWFMVNLEKGGQKFTGALKDLADSYKQRLDKVYTVISSIKDIPYTEDYFPHFWEKPDAAEKFFRDELSKRPLEGSKSFLKQRFYQDIMAGLQAGLKLKSDNPEEIVRIAEINAHKFKMANDLMAELKDNGLAKFFRDKKDVPEGWSKVDDPLFNKMAVFENKEGDPQVSFAGYYMPSDAAEIIKRYTSRGFQGPAIDLIRGWNNTLNQFQLGLSFFHGMTTSIDASVTGTAIAMNEILQGKPIKGAFDLAKSATVIPNLLETLHRGNKAIKDYRSGIINPVVEKMIAANVRTGQDAIYKTDMLFNFQRAMAKHNYGEATARLPFALLDLAAKPIFEKFVPRLKVGGFTRLLENELSKLDNPTQEQINRTSQRVWDDIENRLGQMTYDNLFWNKTTKDIGFLGLRSLGWNLGTARAIGGGLIDVPASAKGIVQGKGGSARTMWVAGLIGQTALMGATYQYLMTGQAPQKWKDYFFPWDGTYNPDKTRHRIALPTYMKDIAAVGYHGLMQTLLHKVSPTVSEVTDIMQNKDFYGEQIYNEDDAAKDKAISIGKYLVDQSLPFTFRTRPDEHLTLYDQFTTAKGLERKFGLMPAMREVEREDWQNQIVHEAIKNSDDKPKTEFQVAAYSAKRELKEQIFNNPLAEKYVKETDVDNKEQILSELNKVYSPLIDKLKSKGYWSDSADEFIKKAANNPYYETFKNLTGEQQLKILSTTDAKVKKELEGFIHNPAVFEKLKVQKPEIFNKHPEYLKIVNKILDKAAEEESESEEIPEPQEAE